MTRRQKAINLYKNQGYNCAQSVAMAYCDVLEMTEENAETVFAGFGGGFGGQHEVCGAISAMTAIMSKIVGVGNRDAESKKHIYSRVSTSCKDFKKEYGSIICRTLLVEAKKKDESAKPCSHYIDKCCHLIDHALGKNR